MLGEVIKIVGMVKQANLGHIHLFILTQIYDMLCVLNNHQLKLEGLDFGLKVPPSNAPEKRRVIARDRNDRRGPFQNDVLGIHESSLS
jgi:hypothetical protein